MDFWSRFHFSRYQKETVGIALAIISAIAYGKTRALAVILKLPCMKKILYGILFAEDETKKDYVLRRVLKNMPMDKFDDCFNVLFNAVKKRHAIKKKIIKFFAEISSNSKRLSS